MISLHSPGRWNKDWRGWYLAVGAVGLLLLGSCARSDKLSTTGATAAPATLGDQLRQVVVKSAESDADFRRDVSPHADRIGCVAEVFGVDPEAAATISDVRTVYSHVYCAGVPATGDLDGAATMVAPIAVRLTKPAHVIVPADGDQYSVDLHRIFPERFWGQAASGPPDADALKAQLRAHLKQLASQRAE